jgi:hypothetical protein
MTGEGLHIKTVVSCGVVRDVAGTFNSFFPGVCTEVPDGIRLQI